MVSFAGHAGAYGSIMRQLTNGLLCATILFGTACTDSKTAALSSIRNTGEQIEIPGGVIHLHFNGDYGQLPRKDVDRWIHTAAAAVQHYFGLFPVKQLDLHIRLKNGTKVEDGVTYDGRRIDISIGTDIATEYLDADWTLTHEMFHLAFPDLDQKHVWMNEGLSTYLEPIARVRLGNMSIEQFWRETLEGMPDGLPEPGDRGLDRTHSWGRTYWGGAMFWFIADVKIREQTDGRKSLDDSIRAILAAGGDGSVRWPIAQVVDVGDRATGTKVLAKLYEEMATHAVSPDLADLWKRLGVRLRGDQVLFDDHAPLTRIRVALTKRDVEKKGM